MATSLRNLELAIAHGDTAETGLLLDAEPQLVSASFPDNGGLTPLMWACRNRHASIVELLLARGAEVNAANIVAPDGEGGNAALWFTAQGPSSGTVPVARLLLERGADINARGERGTTAFFMAAIWMHMELVQLLLAHGADPHLPDADGLTPLQAISKRHDWLRNQSDQAEELKRFGFRAPRMIAFLEKLNPDAVNA